MEMVGGIPIECLTAGELAGVWSGWTTMGDREVVREASAKGTHLKLAHKFLAYRKGWTIGDAQKYFYSEAEKWINELLLKHQIHRAGHIIKNLGKDPLSYVCKICLESTEPELRDYLGKYVENNKGFNDAQIEAWQIVNCIMKYEEMYSLNNKSIENISIEKIVNLSPNIKDPLLTEIYFRIYDSCLSNKLKNNIVWEYLLLDGRVELLIDWIFQQFSDNKHNIIVDENNLTEIFANLKITQEMIDNIDQSNASNPVIETLLNYLSQYGLLNKKEQCDIKLVLSRFIGALITPSKFKSILTKESCNLNVDNFTEKIHSILYYQTINKDKIIHEWYLKDKKLLDIFNNIHETNNINQKIFNRAICQTIHYITDDFDKFLQDNLLITLYLVLSESKENLMINKDNSMSKLSTFKSIIDDKSGLIIDEFTINSNTIGQLKNLPYLKDAINSSSQREDITMYQFLHGYKNLNIHELFKWRQRNETIPNFTNESLIKKYGHKEKLTYKYYLKEARPSMAAYILQNSHGKISNSLSSKMKSQIAFYTHIFGLKHLNNSEIISTCIAFMEFLGIDSEYLRFHTTAANYVQNKLNIEINDLLESITYYQNPEDLETVMSHLEGSFCNEFPTVSLNDITNFISSLKSWNFIYQFAVIHNTKLPSRFLNYLAVNNLWLEFVLTIHIFEYPLEQVLDNVGQFKIKNIREHLLISLMNTQLLESNLSYNNNQKLNLRDNHQSTLYKMPPKFHTTYTSSSACAHDTNNIAESITNPPQYFPLNQTTSPFNRDLWLTILKCHQSQDPPGALLKKSREYKSSILIVLAACYEPSSMPTFCYSWLVISTENDKLIEDYSDCLNDQVWPLKKVSDLFRKIISLGFVDTVRRGLQIFMPENPLCEFFEFLVQYIKHHNVELCEKSLSNFINSCSLLKRNKTIDWQDIETTYLSNEYWIAIVAIECILTVLGTCLDSTHLQIKFLNIFVKHNFNNTLHINNPDFIVLLKIIKSLEITNIKIDFATMEYSTNECNITNEIEKCIRKLIEIEDFTSALELSNIANLPCSKIILNQYRNEFTRNINKNGEIDVTFWRKCALDIEKYNVGFEDAAEFFIEHTERVVSYKERYEILQLALRTLKPISNNQEIIDTVEMAMWKSCVLAGPEAIEITNEKKIFNKLKTELLSVISNLRVNCILNDESEKKAVKALIDRFIDDEDLETALRLCAIFNYKHNDLKILMLCLGIAEGELSPYELNSQQKLLLLEPFNQKHQRYLTGNFGRRRHNSDSSLNLMNLSSFVRNITTANNDNNITVNVTVNPAIQKIQIDCINLIEKLVNNLQHGSNMGKKILLLYKLSTYLKKKYETLLMLQDPMTLLYEMTGMDFPAPEKFILINDVIAAYRIQNTKVVEYLVSEWILHITREVEDDILDDSVHAKGYSLNVQLHVIANFSADSALLGWELLKNANLRLGHSYGAKRDVSALKIIIELFILAHEYFTTSCSMEGIASVLRKCQNLVNTLQQLKLWSLLVRLVTGIGRFTEMNYIFQILKENDRFEFLLKKGLVKFSGLKMALLEFCKKQCPEDKELFNLVALRFQLYNEIAIKWESEAKTLIRELIKETRKENIKLSNLQYGIKFIKNDKTEKTLQLAMDNFTHATEYYLKDNKLSMANRCSCQAQLVALQLSLLNNVSQNHEVISLLNITNDEINKAMSQSLSFPQTLILVQAYNYNADWSSVIYHHVIINGDMRYLKDYLTCKRLTPAIVQDCTCKYRMEKNITKQMTIGMQSLISELNDIQCKYVLASQLGFKNIIEVMISNATTGAYLRDTIWKQGFHPQEFIGENFRS